MFLLLKFNYLRNNLYHNIIRNILYSAINWYILLILCCFFFIIYCERFLINSALNILSSILFIDWRLSEVGGVKTDHFFSLPK